MLEELFINLINTLHIKNVILYNEVVDLAEMRFVFNVYVFIYLLFMISFLCLFVAGLLTVHGFKKKKQTTNSFPSQLKSLTGKKTG